MQVILLATGETARLQPLTDRIVSPMLPLANRPVMSYAVEMLARQGFRNLLVNVLNQPGSIESYFRHGRRWGVELTYVLQRYAWGTAGAVKRSQRTLNCTFVVLPADSFLNVDLNEAVDVHRRGGHLATVVVHSQGPVGAPQLLRDLNGNVQSIRSELPSEPAWFNVGAYVFEPEVLALIPARTCYDIHSQLLPALLAAGNRVHAHPISSYWNPLFTFAQYQAAQQAILHSGWNAPENESPDLSQLTISGQQISAGIWVGRNPTVHPSARLIAPVHIGDNCQIGREVELGPGAIIGDNVIIDDEATIVNSTVLPGTYVGQLVDISERFIHKQLMIDAKTAESIEVIDEFLLSEVSPAIIDDSIRRLADICAASGLILLSLPLLLSGVMLALLASGRLLVYLPRVGRTGREAPEQRDSSHTFQLLRLATSRPDGHQNAFGRLLERLEWHRLPELWQVLTGKLGLVGVKPLTQVEAEHVTESWQAQRYSYIVGWTGIWYIQMLENSSLDDIMVADTYYVAIRSWREDWRILRQTPAGWWKRVWG